MKQLVGVGAAIAVALAAAAPAGAGMAPDPRPGDVALGKSDGIAYVSDPDFAAAAMSLEGGAACPDAPGKWRVTGGGFELSGGADATQRVLGSAPSDILDVYGDNDSKSDDYWDVSAVVSIGTTLETYATCAKWDVIRPKRIDVPNSSSGERKHVARCKRGKISGGGGGIGSGGSYVSSMFPKSLTRWSFKALDAADGAGSVDAYVVCVRGQDLTRVKSTTPVPPSASSPEVTAECPAGRSVVGGGAKSSDVPGALSLRATRPVDDGDAGAVPEDGWAVRAHNTTAAPQELTAFAICAS